MNQRKVGQDMVVRKKPTQPVKVLSAAKTLSNRNSVVTAKTNLQHEYRAPVPSKKPAIYKPTFNQEKFSEVFSPHSSDAPRPPARGGILWLFAGIAVVALIVMIVSIFSKATIAVTLQERVVPVDMAVTLYAEPSGGQVQFKTAKIVDTQSTLVSTTNKQTVTASASGIVRLFSTAAKPVSIPAGTQLISTNKKVFATKSKVVIPGGSINKPGSAEVTISATVPGADSNIKLDDLKLPAFPSIIARTTTEVAGGISGDQFTITEPELIAAKAKLESIMKSSNPAAFLANQIPKDFMLPESLLQISEVTYRTESVEGGVSVIAERTITGNMIDKENFRSFLINQLPESERLFMQIYSDSDIMFSLASGLANTDNTLPIQIKGQFTARAQFDESAARIAIARDKKAIANTTLRALPGVISSEITLFPPWISRIPGKVSAIIFTITYKN